jgi:hypothetical protein
MDENHAGEVAGLLAYFRSLQRQLDLSVVLVHHTRKNAAAGVAAGQGLRGSARGPSARPADEPSGEARLEDRWATRQPPNRAG